MDKETAQEIITHIDAALKLDPNNEAIKKSNADRMQFAVNGIKENLHKFPTLVALRRKHGLNPDGSKD